MKNFKFCDNIDRLSLPLEITSPLFLVLYYEVTSDLKMTRHPSAEFGFSGLVVYTLMHGHIWPILINLYRYKYNWYSDSWLKTKSDFRTASGFFEGT